MTRVEELKELLKDSENSLKEKNEIIKQIMETNEDYFKRVKDLKDDIYFYKKHTYKLQYNIETFELENEKLKKEIEDLKKRFLK